MNFSQALNLIQSGKAHFARQGWGAKVGFIAAQIPDGISKMTAAYLYYSGPDGTVVPYVPTQQDMFATDWVQVA